GVWSSTSRGACGRPSSSPRPPPGRDAPPESVPPEPPARVSCGEMSISVVIPTLDEEERVGQAVRSVRGEADEVLVVDGGSRDGTRAAAAREGPRVLEAPAGRGTLLDHGARSESGDWLLFLLADTWLETGWAAALRALPGAIVGGAFRLAVASPRAGFRVIEAGVRVRCALLRLPYGDQALFAR